VMGKQNYIPQNWAISSLREVALVNPTLDKSAFDDGLEVSFVPMPAVEAETGRIDVSQTKKFGEVKKGYTPFQRGDVLFAKITPCMENGKMAVVPDLHNSIGFGSTEFHVLRAYEGVESKFLYYFVSSKSFRYDAEHNMAGAVGQKRVPTPYFEKCGIPLPPTNEQKRIVALIEELFSELDKGIETFKTAREQLKVYRQAVLKQAFEGKLTAHWRENNFDTIRLQNFISGKEIKDFPELPEGWLYTQLGEVIEEPKYGTSKKCDYDINGIGVLRIPNIVSGVVDSTDLKFANFDAEEINTYSLHQGDILTIRSNGSVSIVGKCALVREQDEKFLYAGYLIRLRPNKELILPEFLNYVLTSHLLRTQIERKAKSTSGVNNINSGELQSLVIPICGTEEQDEVVKILKERLSIIERFEETIEEELQRSEAVRQAILKKAFSGRLVAQDPNDEPASVLLERIRAEKEAQKTEGKKPKQNEGQPKVFKLASSKAPAMQSLWTIT
jgi:type I restriction enzyme, S subunit